MSQAIHVSDETYQAIEALASQQGTTPEAVAETLLKERLAEREAIEHQTAEWLTGVDEALDQVACGETRHFESTEDLFAYLESIPSDKASDE